jgi:8-oxo-dGTP pyrophosphatase MutT (NUDIX family)
VAAEEPFAIVVCFETGDRERFVLARHQDRGWELPGGTVEEGEAPLATARREFHEEIGRRLDDAHLVQTWPTPEGTCHVASGRLGDRLGEGEAAIREWRLVRSLDEVEPLAWPDDPYEEIERALNVELR